MIEWISTKDRLPPRDSYKWLLLIVEAEGTNILELGYMDEDGDFVIKEGTYGFSILKGYKLFPNEDNKTRVIYWATISELPKDIQQIVGWDVGKK